MRRASRSLIAGDFPARFFSPGSSPSPAARLSFSFAALISASTLRTGSLPWTVRSATSAITLSLGAPSSARAWPSLSSREITMVRMRGGSRRSRSELTIVVRSLPTRSASVWCV